MAIQKAYGSITIVDIGDLGTLSVYPESNLPNSVIFDPNSGQNGTYNPDWSSTNLILTPVIYYGGKQIELNDSQLTVTWKRRTGSGNPVNIDTTYGETVSGKKLTVKKNMLTTGSPVRAYICDVTYTEPNSGQSLTAQGQISFSLISQPTTLKSCRISGESVFLYGSDQQIKGSNQITLHGQVTNCEIKSWSYKKINKVNGKDTESWEIIKTESGANYTNLDLVINASTNSSYFINDMATIRLDTNVSGVYDIHTITNIRDGAIGDSVLNVTLSNEDMYVPCDKNGTPTATALDNAKTEIIIYDGDDDISNSPYVSIEPQLSTGTTGQWIVDKKTDNSTQTHPTYKVTSITTDTATVTFKITYIVDVETDTKKIINKTLYLTKLKAGNDGVTPTIYDIKVSTLTLNKTAEHIYSPSTFTVSAKQTTGSTSSDYVGRFKIYSVDAQGNKTEQLVTSGDQKEVSFIPSPGTIYSSFIAELYKAGSTTQKLDSQTITVISDGSKGDDGDPGVTFDFGNPMDVIPCSESGTVSSTYTAIIPFAAYHGTKRIACKVETVNIPTSALNNGLRVSTTTASTETANGEIKLIFTEGKNLGGPEAKFDTGTVAITLTTTGLTSNVSTNKVYTWTKSKQAAAGQDAILVRTYAPSGNVINNGDNDVTLECILTKGVTTVPSSDYTCKWYLFNGSAYEAITVNTPGGYTGYETNTLKVPANAVHSYAAYQIEVTYNSKEYYDYITVQDKTDPLQVEIFSTLGDKITNSVGIGCVYARVYQNGEELDEFQNLIVSTTAPKNPVTDDVWAHIDSENSKITLKKYENREWIALDMNKIVWDCSYLWTFGDYNGTATSLGSSSSSTDKFLYVSGPLINKKMQFNLKVEQKEKEQTSE